uniref:Zonadhesin n=1 Tax=Noccaea caerulescens TaxID=107243 RepID=A0A1J3HEY4_NOCCA
MNRSFRAQESLLLDSAERQRQQLRASMMAEKDEELSLFLEMRRREKEQDNLLLNNSDEFETPLGSKPGTSPVFNISSGAPARKTGPPDDFLNSEGDKNDYEWLLTPPGTPLFPSLEMESHRTKMSQTGDSKGRPATLTSRLANSSSSEPAARNHLTSRQPTSSPGLSSSSGASRRPSSSGGPGSRPATPTGRSSSLTTNSKPSRPSTPTSRATVSSTTRPSMTNSRSTVSATTKPTALSRSTSSSRLTPTASKPTLSTARSVGSTTRSTTSTATKSAGPSRSTTPLSRSTARSSTPTSRPTLPPPKTVSRSATPTRRPISSASAGTSTAKPTISQVKPSSPAAKPMPTPSKTPAVSRGASPTVRSRPWKPSDMPGFSLETPPNLRTTLPERPLSATRGRPGAPSPRSGSVEPGGPTGGRPRRQSCSPSRGRAPMYTSGSSVPAINRNYSKANDNVSPVLMGTKMVERVINMRKLAPPRPDDNKSSPHGNLSAKSSSPDSAGFGRSLSKKSLDMAIRHMDIRRTIPGNLRPLMTNIPASSMYSVRSGHTRGRPMNVSDSPLATSSNASSEISVYNNNGNCLEASEKEDDAGSERGCRSPASLQGR